MFFKNILWQAHEANISGANIAMLEYMDVLRNEFKFIVVLPHEGNMCTQLKKKEIEYKIVRQYNWGVNIKSVSFYKAIKIKDRKSVV